MASSLFVHQRLRTFERGVDRILCVSDFVRGVLLRSGMDPAKLIVKPNVVDDLRLLVPPDIDRQNTFVYVGRLAPEKGVRHLIEAWGTAALGGWTLRIIGDGPERTVLEAMARGLGSVEFDGWLERPAVADAMARGRFLVVPSLWYETYALGVTEAQSLGTPAIAPEHGPFVERIRHGDSGLLYRPGDVGALAAALTDGARAVESGSWSGMSRFARHAFDLGLVPRGGAQELMEIYEDALRDAQRSSTRS
jgi:glycosyltransferase involved in cell wall biosynthesis